MKRLLIIRPDGIGDFVIFSAVLEEYARRYQGYENHLVCNRSVRGLAETIPFISRIICVDLSRPCSTINVRAVGRLLLEGPYDTIIYPAYSRYRWGDFLTRLARGKEKIAFDGDDCNDPRGTRAHRNRWYTRIIEGDKGAKLELERNVELLTKLGVRVEPGRVRPRIWFAAADETHARELIDYYQLRGGGYVVACPGAGQRMKWWGSQNWAELLVRLVRQYPDSRVVLLGKGQDRELIDEILGRVGECGAAFLNLCDRTTLRMTAKIIQHARALVSADTSAVHIAAAVGTPTLCLMGGGHFGRFYPYGDLTRNRIVYRKLDCYGCNWECSNSIPFECIRSLSPGEIWTELQALLSGVETRTT